MGQQKDLQAAEVRDGAMRDREVILSGYGQTPIRQRQQKSPKRQPGEPRMPNHVRLAQANRQPLFDKR